jgi:hypothetical protein
MPLYDPPIWSLMISSLYWSLEIAHHDKVRLPRYRPFDMLEML